MTLNMTRPEKKPVALFAAGTKSAFDPKANHESKDTKVEKLPNVPELFSKTPETFHPISQAFNPNAGKDIAKYGTVVNPKTLELLTLFNTSTGILDFGNAEIAEIAKHSDAQLDAVKDVDISFVEQQLVGVMSLAKSLKLDQSEHEKSFSLHSVVNMIRGKVIDFKEQAIGEFTNTATKIDGIVGEVDLAVDRVKNKIAGFEVMYADNISAYQNLTTLLVIAEEALTIKKTDLEVAKTTVNSDLLSMEEINRLQSSITRLEKKIINFKKYQLMAIQNAPEISQMMDQALIIIDKFNDIKNMTIPLWKRSIRKYIDGAELRRAAMLEKTVNDANNNLLQQNSNQSKQNAIDIAHLSNRDVVDDETLETINRNLIDTIIEVSQINQDGATKRTESLQRMEEMKKLYSNIATGRISNDKLKEERKKFPQLQIVPTKPKSQFSLGFKK